MITTIINLTMIRIPSGRGAAMIIESLRLFYHIRCFKCCVCRYPHNNANYIFLISAIAYCSLLVSLQPPPTPLMPCLNVAYPPKICETANANISIYLVTLLVSSNCLL